jgi:23S rRNA (cytidine1920-2'-O)/16S rRNA (cytidine1409-2'-O)-methyltransferase
MNDRRKERLDLLLVEKGLAESQDQAQRLIMAGLVRVGDGRVDKPGTRVPAGAELTIQNRRPYASRGGHKLAAALDAFAVDVRGFKAADVGASTGGFTDCLLQRGAKRVYAIDVGYGQLAWKLQQDPRVVVMDRTNARHLKHLPELMDLVTIDASFISLKLILPTVAGWLKDKGQILALIKPQFEARSEQVEEGGVVRDPALHRQILEDILSWSSAQGLAPLGLIHSPIRGPAGNMEFLAHMRLGTSAKCNHGKLVADCLKAVEGGDHG